MLYAAMRRYPHVGETEPPSLSGIRQGPALRAQPQDLLGTYVVDLARDAAGDADRALPGAGGAGLRQAPAARAALLRRDRRRAASRPRCRGWTSRVHHHGRAIVIAAMAYGACIALAGLSPHDLGRAALLRPGRRRRHDLGGLPRHDLEPDDPRQHARPAGRHRDAELLHRPARPARYGPASSPTGGRSAGRSSAAACAASPGSALTAMWLHDFWRYDARTDEHAVAERQARQLAGERARSPDEVLPPPDPERRAGGVAQSAEVGTA